MSSRLLSGCRRFSSVRHCCVVSFGVCHWHRYVILMACAPHLSFLVVVFSLIMVLIARPRVGCVEEVGLCVILVEVCCDDWGWFVWGVSGGGVGNNVLACCSVALMVLGVFLYMSRNSFGVSMPILSGFWICAIIVIPYMYSLSKCFLSFCFGGILRGWRMLDCFSMLALVVWF